MAVNSVIVDYDTKNFELSIPSIEDSVERSSFFKVPPITYPKKSR